MSISAVRPFEEACRDNIAKKHAYFKYVSGVRHSFHVLELHHGKNDQGGLDGLSEASIARVVQEFSR